MRYNEVLEHLQNLTKCKITQADLCKVLNVKQSAMGNRQSRNSNFSEEEIITLQNHYNVILKNEDVTIDYYPDVFGSCGNGVFELSPEKTQIIVPKNAFFSLQVKFVLPKLGREKDAKHS
jgi:hypothetical protein